MPGPWIHLEDNPEFFATFSVAKGEYLEVNVYDGQHDDQGRALVRVLASEDRKREGLWIQGKLIAVTDSHLKWWLTDGPGNQSGRKFYFHLCNAKVANCRKTKRRPNVEFHSDYFRVLTTAEVTGRAVAWFKDPIAKVDVDAEVARLEGEPAAAALVTSGRGRKGDQKSGIQWEATEDENDPAEAATDETEVKKKLEALKTKLKEGEAVLPPAGEKEKGKRKGRKARDKKALKDRKKHGGKRKRNKLESDDSSLTDHRPMWFGQRRDDDSSTGSSSESSREGDDPPAAAGSKDKPKDDKKEKKKKKKVSKADRGPYGVGAKMNYGGEEADEGSSDEDVSDKTSFRAAPSHTSKQLQLQEYADKYPGRLASRLLKRMQTILARGEGAMNLSGKNQTPAVATAYLITVVEPRYKET